MNNSLIILISSEIVLSLILILISKRLFKSYQNLLKDQIKAGMNKEKADKAKKRVIVIRKITKCVAFLAIIPIGLVLDIIIPNHKGIITLLPPTGSMVVSSILYFLITKKNVFISYESIFNPNLSAKDLISIMLIGLIIITIILTYQAYQGQDSLQEKLLEKLFGK